MKTPPKLTQFETAIISLGLSVGRAITLCDCEVEHWAMEDGAADAFLPPLMSYMAPELHETGLTAASVQASCEVVEHMKGLWANRDKMIDERGSLEPFIAIRAQLKQLKTFLERTYRGRDRSAFLFGCSLGNSEGWFGGLDGSNPEASWEFKEPQLLTSFANDLNVQWTDFRPPEVTQALNDIFEGGQDWFAGQWRQFWGWDFINAHIATIEETASQTDSPTTSLEWKAINYLDISVQTGTRLVKRSGFGSPIQLTSALWDLFPPYASQLTQPYINKEMASKLEIRPTTLRAYPRTVW